MSRFAVLVSGVEQPGIPTPRLIEAGGGEAFFLPSDRIKSGGVWYLNEPGTMHTPEAVFAREGIVVALERATVRHADDYEVSVSIEVDDPAMIDQDKPDPIEVTYPVEAFGEADARARATALARAEAREWSEDPAQITIVSTRKVGY